jgi:hypothetical protein
MPHSVALSVVYAANSACRRRRQDENRCSRATQHSSIAVQHTYHTVALHAVQAPALVSPDTVHWHTVITTRVKGVPAVASSHWHLTASVLRSTAKSLTHSVDNSQSSNRSCVDLEWHASLVHFFAGQCSVVKQLILQSISTRALKHC